MKIKNIMTTNSLKNKNLKKNNGINENENIYNTRDRLDKLEEYIDVYDNKGIKVGEVCREILLKVNKSQPLELFTNVLQTIEEGVFIVDSEGIIVFANIQYSKMLNVSLKNIIGKHIQNIEPEADINLVLENHKATLLKRKQIKSIDKYVTGKILPIFDDEKFIGALSMFLDSTELENLEREVIYNKQKVVELEDQLNLNKLLDEDEVIGKSTNFVNILEKSQIAARTDVPILLNGENGTGKDILAKFIHKNSERSNKPFITVNCAAIPETLIESELFGYEPGSFTGGSSKGKLGKFELANGGTLFLDEIGDMPLTMQSKILRAIQNKEIEKIGRNESVNIDVRIITATNQDLEKMIGENKFRRDLYYRINLVTLELPPLRERGEDIALLSNYFLNNYNKKYTKDVKFIKSDISYIYKNDWLGNIRELKNFIEYGVIMSLDNKFEINYKNCDRKSLHFEEALEDKDKSLKERTELFEKQAILDELKLNNYNKTKTMEKLDISRRTFYRKLSKYGIE